MNEFRVAFEDLSTGECYGEWFLTPSQEKFWESKKKFVLFSGGYGAGKSLILTLKAIDLSLKYAGNYILMGRKTYPELRDTLLKEFFTVCPDALIKDYLKAEGRVIFHNGSEIIFRHLDTIAESEIRSLNLGAAFIDQAEDISQAVVMGLRGRLRRNVVAEGDRRIFLTCNPALTWLFAEFKQNPKPEYEVIECSTLENEKNLPKEYIEDLLKYPESYKKQYVYGIWDIDLLSTNTVFAPEYIQRLGNYAKDPIRIHEGWEIYREFIPKHRYQVGVDIAEGGEGSPTDGMKKKDSTVITVTDIDTLEECAVLEGYIIPDVAAEKTAYITRLYSDKNTKPLVIPEMNSMGMAFVNKLRDENDIIIYQREEMDRTTMKRMKKLGWRTTRQTKPLLVSHFQDLLRLKDPKVYSRKTVEQFKSFVHSDEANSKGMGAKQGFHDDRIISLLLSFWDSAPVQGGVLRERRDGDTIEKGYRIINGKIYLNNLKPDLQLERSWKTL